MFILENVPLNAFSTMRLGGVAAYLVEITDKFEVQKAVEWARERELAFIMIGEGSNIIWKDEGFPGLVMVNKIPGFEISQQDEEISYVTVGAGENWDAVVERTTKLSLSGIEELSLIPGTAGATPVQNVGAYGREISEVLMTIEAFDTEAHTLVMLRASECEFSYRSSMFKTTQRGRYLITGMTMQLRQTMPSPPFYAALAQYLDQNKITSYTPQIIRDAVVAIRSAKLPDPKLVANNGSFFQNPIIPKSQAVRLAGDYPNIMYWDLDDGNVKVAAAWLVEAAGFKDFHDEATGMATWAKQPLVFVNEHATSTQNLIEFREKVKAKVKDMFGIDLKQESEILP